MKIIICLVGLLLTLTACGETSEEVANEDSTYELDIISFLPTSDPLTEDIIPMWLEHIEEGTDGQVQPTWIGGPEAIPADDQFSAVTSGSVDVAFTASSWFVNQVPESDSLLLSPYSPNEERENGYYDYMAERFEEHAIAYLGRWISENPFYLMTNDSISSLEDLEGLEFRSNPVYHGIMTRLGISQTDIDPADVYTSLDRGLVNGVAFPIVGTVENGWTEALHYVINEPFFTSQNATILMNQESLSSLPDDLQNQIMEITADFEQEMFEYFEGLNENYWNQLEEEGVEEIILSDQDAEMFQTVVEEEKWGELEENLDSDVYQNLEAYLRE